MTKRQTETLHNNVAIFLTVTCLHCLIEDWDNSPNKKISTDHIHPLPVNNWDVTWGHPKIRPGQHTSLSLWGSWRHRWFKARSDSVLLFVLNGWLLTMPQHCTLSVCVATFKIAGYETHWIIWQSHENSTSRLRGMTMFFPAVSVGMRDGEKNNRIKVREWIELIHGSFSRVVMHILWQAELFLLVFTDLLEPCLQDEHTHWYIQIVHSINTVNLKL